MRNLLFWGHYRRTSLSGRASHLLRTLKQQRNDSVNSFMKLVLYVQQQRQLTPEPPQDCESRCEQLSMTLMNSFLSDFILYDLSFSLSVYLGVLSLIIFYTN